MIKRVWNKIHGCFWLFLLVGCAGSATGPAPIAEIPSVLTAPQDLSIESIELQGAGGALGMKLGSLVKAQVVDSRDIRSAIQVATGIFIETNAFLNGALSFINRPNIPVEPTLVHFTHSFETEGRNFEVKYDFGRFDLDRDGVLEACSGCTCPVGCAPTISECPGEAPVDELQKICFRVWVNGKRFMAGVFDRVPTIENPQSGQMRTLLLEEFDLGGSNMGIRYDHSNPQNLATALSLFLKDKDVNPDNFYGRRRSLGTQVGPEAQSKKTLQLAQEAFDDRGSSFNFQGQYFSHLDFIELESIPQGTFETVLGLVDITPPICAQISSADPVAQVLCDDLGLGLTAGDFPALPELSETELPPLDQFPESPTS